ncbi:MAG: membrane protein, putative [uncultured Sulfurovum sp.]|uniref:Membrane protein, putative n=1 Tax=uncultured Sulfurovum sp. TaxID=269237 RepID=A0A6S6T761_9BACT|nr:MAG: membrane protein, putative [uncultured Sulfurovum sp.]
MLFKIFLLFTFLVSFVQGDILKPAYLEVIQKKQNTYKILLKLPVEGDKKPLVNVKSIEDCEEKNIRIISSINASYLKRYDLICNENLKGKVLEIEGLEDSRMDLLLRLEFLDNSSQSVLLNASQNSYFVQEDASSLQIIQTYTWLGITHILMGFDHLLFVFLLLLIVKNMRLLLWTISAFTLAHSLTIAGATLGLVHLPQQPVEAIIALSILFLALEIVYASRGKVGLTLQYPWLIAFIFGLLHGFGFAGALAEIGLPAQAITLALVFFNIGVEVGQLIFVAMVMLLALPLRHLVAVKSMKKLEMLVVYAIGGLAAFWTIERVLAF